MRISTRWVQVAARKVANAEVIECAARSTIIASVSQAATITRKKTKTRTMSRKRRNRMTMKLPSLQTISVLSTRAKMI